MIVVSITAGNKSYVEKIPESQTRINIDPGYYRDIHFTLDGREVLEKYKEHFIYGYLETLNQEGDLPGFVLKADKLEIDLKREK